MFWAHIRVSHGGFSHLGVVASRKTGGAVQRNRFKRLIREAFRKMRKELPAVDLVVVAKDSWKTSAWNQTQVCSALRNALEGLSCLKRKPSAPIKRVLYGGQATIEQNRTVSHPANGGKVEC